MTEPADVLGSLMKYTSVQRWIRQLRKNSANMENGGVPAATLAYVKMAMERFMAFTGKNPDEMIAEAEEAMRRNGSTRDTDDLIDQFWDSCKTKTTAGNMFNTLKGFYKWNHIRLAAKTPKIPTIRKEEIELTNSIIRQVVSVAPIQHASWMLADNYLFLRVDALTMLTVEDFHTENWARDEPLYPVFINDKLSGTFSYTAFIGHDAMELLKTYFATRKFKSEDHPWGFRSSNMIDAFKKYAYKAGIIQAPNGVNRNGVPKGLCLLRTHGFRKRGQHVLEDHNIVQNRTDRMIGHQPSGSDGKHYSLLSTDERRDIYMEILPDLEIFGHHSQSPTSPNVASQKDFIMQMVKNMPGMNPEKLDGIQNLMKTVRTKAEVDDAFHNVMVMVKEK